MTVATPSAHLAPLRTEMKWWRAALGEQEPEPLLLIIVVGGDVLPSHQTQEKLLNEFPGVGPEYFTVAETQIAPWECIARCVPVSLLRPPERPPVVGPYQWIYAGDPQARALGAKPGDYLYWRRTAADGESPEDYWSQVIHGDAHAFNQFGTEASVGHIRDLQAEGAAESEW